MRRSWLGLQLVLLSCTLLLAVIAVEGRSSKEEEESSKGECCCEKRHHCVEECCCKKRCHCEEEECRCKKRHHHKHEECCKRCHCEEEECRCKKRHHHKHEECCRKRCHCEEEECRCKKRHHHKHEEHCKKKHSHGKDDAGKNKDSHDGEKHPRKRMEEAEEARWDSSEHYKNWAKEEQQRLMEQAAQSPDAVPDYRKEQAIFHFNRGSNGTYYKHLEDGQLEVKKAIGVMVYVKTLLIKTNCTKTKEQEEAGVEYSRAYLEKEGCQVLPQLKLEKHNCTFGIFIDMRTEKKAVVSQECIIIPRIKQLPKLRGLAF